jgi:hypothetical protein
MAKKKKRRKSKPRDVDELDEDQADEDEEQDEESDESSLVTSTGKLVTRRLFRPRLLFAAAVLVSAGICFPQLKSLLPNLRQHDGYRLRIEDIHISSPPRWTPVDLVEQVLHDSNLSSDASLLDDDLASQLAAAFAKHAWIENVEAVRIVPHGIEVELTYRRPIAIVQMPQGGYPIDPRGILLPPEDFSEADARRLPQIQNVKSIPQGAAGNNWGDVGVVAAARLAETLTSRWEQFRLAAIRVPERTSSDETLDEMIFELVSTGGSRIVWGRAPGAQHPGELEPAQKIGKMEDYQRRFGSFDEPDGPCRIEIYHWTETTRRPLSASRKKTPRQ